jgi:hypothetical protein
MWPNSGHPRPGRLNKPAGSKRTDDHQLRFAAARRLR